jgi:hypothetical protein
MPALLADESTRLEFLGFSSLTASNPQVSGLATQSNDSVRTENHNQQRVTSQQIGKVAL